MQCKLCCGPGFGPATYKCIPPKDSGAPVILLCDNHAKTHLKVCVYRGKSVMQKIEWAKEQKEIGVSSDV